MDLSQSYVSGSLCHANAPIQQRNDLYLTSCAHIICREHASKDPSYHANLENSKIRCPVCNHDYVSLVKIDSKLPTEIKPFFTPFPNQVEQLFASAQFQYCALVERINSQNDLVERLVQKINKQKTLLSLAKEKVAQIEEMENKILMLEKENHILKSTSNSRIQNHERQNHNLPPRPETIDLTANDSIDNLPGMDQRKIVTRSFVDQIKQSSTQRSVSLGRNHRESASFDLTKGRMAESTNILSNSPIKRFMNNPTSNPFADTRSGSTHSNNSHRIMSNDSSNSSLSSRTPEPFLQPTPTTNTNQKTLGPARVSKNRALTSQLAQRLSAHMKIGRPVVGFRGKASSSDSVKVRPGSSFNQNPLFRKR